MDVFAIVSRFVKDILLAAFTPSSSLGVDLSQLLDLSVVPYLIITRYEPTCTIKSALEFVLPSSHLKNGVVTS